MSLRFAELAPPPHYHDNTIIPAVQLRAAWLLARDSPYEGWVGLFTEQSEFDNWSCHTVTHAASQAQVSGSYPRLYRIGAALMVQLADMTCWAVYPDGDSKLLF